MKAKYTLASHALTAINVLNAKYKAPEPSNSEKRHYSYPAGDREIGYGVYHVRIGSVASSLACLSSIPSFQPPVYSLVVSPSIEN
jgi:hypothetical protein